jgi:SAM-dependent methyltransferase
MPYPLGDRISKHDLLCPKFSSKSCLFDSCGFPDVDSVFSALNREIPSNLVPIASVYSYNDSPSPPLARSLFVIGVVHSLESPLGIMIADDSRVPSCLHRCTIAVKRADGVHAQSLTPQELSLSHAFARFLRQLRREKLVGIVGQDKYKRFCIFASTDDMTTEGDFEAQDFAALCYIGDVRVVQNYCSQSAPCLKRPHPSLEAPLSSEDDVWKPSSDVVWKPPDVDYSSWIPSNSETDHNGISNVWPTAAVTKSNEDDNATSFHADAGAAAADRFYSGLTRTLDTRAESRLFHMRAFNGWVKATQIQELDPKTSFKKGSSPLRLLDLACGKGGDLGKWILHPRGVQNYVGIDVARGSLVDAAIRARKLRQKLKRCSFICADLGADVPGRLKTPSHKRMQKLPTWSLERDGNHASDVPEFKLIRGGAISQNDKFDVVSIQFAIHYMMETKKRALRFFQTVSELLDIGGNLIVTTIDARVIVNHLMNMGLDLHFDDGKGISEPVVITVGAGACRIRFEPEVIRQIFTTKWNDKDDIEKKLFGLQYSFTLVEGSDHASGIGDAVDLPEWLIPIPVLEALAQQSGLEMEYAQNFHEFFNNRSDPSIYVAAHTSLYNMKVLNRNGSISEDEYEISGLYVAIKFRKIRESRIQINKESDNEELSDGDELEDIDPALKSKLFPVALMKAKNVAGNDIWSTMSSDEKKRRTELELRKLLPT